MIYYKIQYLHSSGELPSYICPEPERKCNCGEAMFLPTIFCVIFQLGIFSATRNKNLTVKDCNNICLPIMPMGGQFQDWTGSSAITSFLSFRSVILRVLFFYLHSCPHVVLRASLFFQWRHKEEERDHIGLSAQLVFLGQRRGGLGIVFNKPGRNVGRR